MSPQSFASCPTITEESAILTVGNTIIEVVSPRGYPVAQLFSLQVSACVDNEPWQGKLKLDAKMPSHGHGMNYRPEVTMQEAGHYQVDGLMFHMPGQWQLRFDLPGVASKSLLLTVQTD